MPPRQMSAPKNGDRRAVEYLKGATYVLTVLVAAVGAHYATKEELLERIRGNGTDIRRLEDRVKQLMEECKTHHSDFVTHCYRGPDGLPHPEGTISVLKRLDDRLKAVEECVAHE